MIGVDWGDVTRWVLVGRKTKNKFYVIDTGVFDDIDTMKSVEKLKLIVSRERIHHKQAESESILFPGAGCQNRRFHI